MKKLIRLRRLAFELQQGCCFYCGARMWLKHPREVFEHRDLTSKVASYLKCTAEHLKPVSEGRRDEPGNIVAACLFCKGLPLSGLPTPFFARDRRLQRGYVAFSGIRWTVGVERIGHEPSIPSADAVGDIGELNERARLGAVEYDP